MWVRNRKEYEPLQADLAGQFNLHIEKLLDPIVLNEITSAFTIKQLQSDTVVSSVGTDKIPAEIMIQPLSPADKIIILKYLYQIKEYTWNMFRIICHQGSCLWKQLH